MDERGESLEMERKMRYTKMEGSGYLGDGIQKWRGVGI